MNKRFRRIQTIVADIRDQREPLDPTHENMELSREYLMEMWIQRHAERVGKNLALADRVPTDLSYSCKFTSLFIAAVFGGEVHGNEWHQFAVIDGTVFDPNSESDDVLKLTDPYEHDEYFFGNREHLESVQSCAARVKQWVNGYDNWLDQNKKRSRMKI